MKLLCNYCFLYPSFSQSVAPWDVTCRSVASLFEIQNDSDRLILLVPVIAKLSDDAIVKAELLEVIRELKIQQLVSQFCYQ